MINYAARMINYGARFNIILDVKTPLKFVTVKDSYQRQALLDWIDVVWNLL